MDATEFKPGDLVRVKSGGPVMTVEQIGLPCETALEKGFEDVHDPRISVGAVSVEGDEATAQVRSSTEGQEPSEDTVLLVRVDDPRHPRTGAPARSSTSDRGR